MREFPIVFVQLGKDRASELGGNIVDLLPIPCG
jgi:hypothetical protein